MYLIYILNQNQRFFFSWKITYGFLTFTRLTQYQISQRRELRHNLYLSHNTILRNLQFFSTKISIIFAEKYHEMNPLFADQHQCKCSTFVPNTFTKHILLRNHSGTSTSQRFHYICGKNFISIIQNSPLLFPPIKMNPTCNHLSLVLI